MSETQTIVRFAAKGDGVTASGRHVPGSVPGDRVDINGHITPGPNRAKPPCPHFGDCGGCQLQYADDAALSDFVTARVVNAAEAAGLEIGELLPTHLSPPHSRRRATLHALRTQKGAVIGFRAGGSHRIVDLQCCEILDPRLFAHVHGLRDLIAEYGSKGPVDIGLAICDQGVDIVLKNLPMDNLKVTQAVSEYAQAANVARLCVDLGYGPETVWEPEPVTISFAGVPVSMPSGAFLQATVDAEARMLADAKEWLDGAGTIVDLLSGLGTFAFGLRDGRKVLAVEADRPAHLSCKAAAAKPPGGVFAMHRDLFRNPLEPHELNRFGAVLLDPPRAGAKAQIKQIADSEIKRVVYVSCNPSSWSRDAAKLAASGFRLAKLRPVGQFRWSTHVELTSLLVR